MPGTALWPGDYEFVTRTAKNQRRKTNNSGVKKVTEEQEKNYRALQREIINTENQLKNLKLEASNWTTASNNLKKYSESMSRVGKKKLKKLLEIHKLNTNITILSTTLRDIKEVVERGNVLIFLNPELIEWFWFNPSNGKRDTERSSRGIKYSNGWCS